MLPRNHLNERRRSEPSSCHGENAGQLCRRTSTCHIQVAEHLPKQCPQCPRSSVCSQGAPALQFHAMESPIRLHCCKIPTDGFTPEHHCSPNLSVHTCVQTPCRTTEPSSLTQGSESSTPGAGTAPCIHLTHPVRRCLQSRPHNKHFGSSQSTAGASQPALTEPRAAGAAGRRGTTHKLEEKDDK